MRLRAHAPPMQRTTCTRSSARTWRRSSGGTRRPTTPIWTCREWWSWYGACELRARSRNRAHTLTHGRLERPGERPLAPPPKFCLPDGLRLRQSSAKDGHPVPTVHTFVGDGRPTAPRRVARSAALTTGIAKQWQACISVCPAGCGPPGPHERRRHQDVRLLSHHVRAPDGAAKGRAAATERSMARCQPGERRAQGPSPRRSQYAHGSMLTATVYVLRSERTRRRRPPRWSLWRT